MNNVIRGLKRGLLFFFFLISPLLITATTENTANVANKAIIDLGSYSRKDKVL